MANQGAVRLNAGSDKMVIALGPIEQQVSNGKFSTDAGLLILDKDGLSLFSATKADLDGSPLYSSPKPDNADIAVPDSISAIDGLQAVQPAAARGIQAKIPAQKLVWEKSIAAAGKTPDAGSPITRLAVASLDGPSKARSILVGTAAGSSLRPERRRNGALGNECSG